jgi:superfamily I DNA/RNA helicase
MTPSIEKVFGPPGTGKTTYLLNVVDKELEAGVSSERIGYFSFTRKAANEARDRAVTKFPNLIPKTDFPFFRTLHSLAYHVLAVKPDLIMQPENYREFAEQAGIEIKLNSEDDTEVSKADNPILNEINLARIRGIDLRQHYNESGLDIEWYHFEFVERTYRHYKRSRDLLDFTDLLEMAVTSSDQLPSLEVLIVDEAQDLSRLQWQLVEALAAKAKRVYLAGDDDQAVFTWAGADVKSFLSFQGTIKILQQSYRVPSAVHQLADKIVHRIRSRQSKEWKPREFEGSVTTYDRFEDVDVSQGQWLILASTNYLLNPIGEWLKSHGLLFERSGIPSVGPTILKAVVNWERLRQGQMIPGEEMVNIYRYLDSDYVARGHRSFKGERSELFTMAQLQTDYGLLSAPIWHEALGKIAHDKREYLISVLRRGSRLSDGARIKLSTIHGAKGGEADNVLLLMDISTRFAKELQKNGDDVHRLFYVGVTRAKKSLHLVLPKFQDKGFML